jgi:hypothetical protein
MIKKLKWVSVIISVIAAITISFKLTDVAIAYVIFFIGHTSMSFIMLKERDWSLFTMNLIWVIIDIIGFINWV